MRLSKIHEALDDIDTFRPVLLPQRRIRRHPVKKCAFCSEVDMYSRPFWYDDQAWSYEAYGIKKEGKGNPLQFHMLHQHWAKLNGDVNIWNIRSDQGLADNFHQFMAKYGWVPKPNDTDPLSFMKAPVKEDLDDQDEFDCMWCKAFIHGPHPAAGVENQAAVHAAHQAAEMAKPSTIPYSAEIFYDTMARLGYFKTGSGWIRKPVQESLDDKDEFDKNCNWYLCDLRDTDRDEFHTAHIAASQAATRATKDSADRLRPDEIDQLWKNMFYKTMNKYGYVHKPSTSKSVGDWIKKPVQESLDDKDEFAGSLVATGTIKEVNSYAGTEWVLTFKHAGDTSQGTEQERIIYALPKVTFGKFPKYTWINGVKFDVEVIMDMDGTIGFYDDGDIRELNG